MILQLLLIAILLAFILIIIGLLVIPFRISLRVSASSTATDGEISVRWLGLRLLRRRIEGGEPTGKSPSHKVDVLKMLQLGRESLPSLLMLFRAFRRSVSITRLSASVNFGLGDPAETATITGYVWTVICAFNLIPRVSLVFKPDLEKPRLDGSVAGEVGVTLFPLVFGFLRAYTKKPFRALIREARRGGRS